MEYLGMLRAINKSTMSVIRDTVTVTPLPPTMEEENLPRLEENPFILTDEVRNTVRAAVTAHDLSQYKSRFHSIHLDDNVQSWLTYLLEADREVSNGS